MSQFARTLLVLFLALMQCIAPVAHAHVDGHNVGHGIHIGEEEGLFAASAENTWTQTTVTAQHPASAVISMPTEHRTDSCAPVCASITPHLIVTPNLYAGSQAFVWLADHLHASFEPYALPFGQAPPSHSC